MQPIDGEETHPGEHDGSDQPGWAAQVSSSPAHRQLTGVPTAPGVAFGRVVELRPATGTYSAVSSPGEGQVVVAAELSPGDVASLPRDVVIAVAIAAGAPLSHASILVRSLGIPAVTGLGPALLEVPVGTLVLVDGDSGTVQVEPSPAALESARARRLAARRRQDEARRHAAAEAFTRDGCPVPVFANVGGPEEARSAVREGADGVGMLRTEFAFLNRADPPDESEQYLAYRGVADAVGERPLVVRTLDLGADVPAWNARPEPNPALGNRGLRLTLAERDLLATQLRAVVRLAEDHPVGLMFPMVTTVEELRRARACLEEATKERASKLADGSLEIGITVEVPASAITADVFAQSVDFFAIGTNDLTQYTLAADRANAAVAAIADGLHPAVLRLIGQVTAAGERYGRTVCVVGELGSDRLAIPVLLGLGVTTLSVRPNAIAAVKQVVRGVVLDQARALAEAALEAESATVVRELVSAYWGRHA